MGAIFLEKKNAPTATYPQVKGFQKSRAVFLEEKAPAAMYPQVRGFQDLGTKKNGELEKAEPLKN